MGNKKTLGKFQNLRWEARKLSESFKISVGKRENFFLVSKRKFRPDRMKMTLQRTRGGRRRWVSPRLAGFPEFACKSLSATVEIGVRKLGKLYVHHSFSVLKSPCGVIPSGGVLQYYAFSPSHANFGAKKLNISLIFILS
ncbi:MAG: hypothetical protein HUJ99_05945 [Bacteroidaceae bacterium]|nr:hypothetical protein [Bacteroidaceae bacterium]